MLEPEVLRFKTIVAATQRKNLNRLVLMRVLPAPAPGLMLSPECGFRVSSWRSTTDQYRLLLSQIRLNFRLGVNPYLHPSGLWSGSASVVDQHSTHLRNLEVGFTCFPELPSCQLNGGTLVSRLPSAC